MRGGPVIGAAPMTTGSGCRNVTCGLRAGSSLPEGTGTIRSSAAACCSLPCISIARSIAMRVTTTRQTSRLTWPASISICSLDPGITTITSATTIIRDTTAWVTTLGMPREAGVVTIRYSNSIGHATVATAAIGKTEFVIAIVTIATTKTHARRTHTRKCNGAGSVGKIEIATVMIY
jgi:hypothetical protein